MKSSLIRFCNVPTIEKKIIERSIGPKILFYHGVEIDLIDKHIQSLHIPIKSFEKQIDFIQNYYEIISIEELSDYFRNGGLNGGRFVVLTFDDGYRNNLEVVLPYLESKSIPFSVFVSTNNIDTGQRFPTYILRVGIFKNINTKITIPSLNKVFNIFTKGEQNRTYLYLQKIIKSSSNKIVNQIINDIINTMPTDIWDEKNELFSSDAPMSWEDIDTLFSKNVIIGSHAHNHFIFHQNQSDEDIIEELTVSKQKILDRYKKCEYFCYPNGAIHEISHLSYNSVADNFKLAFTTCAGEVSIDSDKFLLPRIGISNDFEVFKYYLNTTPFRNKAYQKKIKIFSQPD
jgi:hypothetical protein